MSRTTRPERQSQYRVVDLFTRPVEEGALDFRWSWCAKNRCIEQEPLGGRDCLMQLENANA